MAKSGFIAAGQPAVSIETSRTNMEPRQGHWYYGKTQGEMSEYVHVVEISPRTIRCAVYYVNNGLPQKWHQVRIEVNSSAELLAVESYFNDGRKLIEPEIAGLQRQFNTMPENQESLRCKLTMAFCALTSRPSRRLQSPPETTDSGPLNLLVRVRWLRKWQDWLSLALAVWIAASPAVFPQVSGGTVVVVGGAALVLIALIALEHPLSMVQEAIQLLVAAFTFSAPWIFHFRGGVASNLQASSFALVALTVGSIAMMRRLRLLLHINLPERSSTPTPASPGINRSTPETARERNSSIVGAHSTV